MKDTIGLIKIIKHNLSATDYTDDPSMPWKLEVSLRLTDEPSTRAFFALHGGSEQVVVRGDSLEALENFIDRNGYRWNHHLIKLTITGPTRKKY